MIKKYVLSATLLLLAACTTPEEREAARLLQIENDIATCRSYGLKEGSEAFGNCRLQLDIARKQTYDYPTHIYGGFGHHRGGGIGIGRGF